MSNSTIELKLHHTKDELEQLYKKAKNPIERTRLHFLSIIRSKNSKSTQLAISIKTAMKRVWMSLTWSQDTIRRYNKLWLDWIIDARKNNKRPKIIETLEQEKLKEQINTWTSPDWWLWTWPKVALYLWEILDKKVSAVTGWKYLVSLGFSLKTPRLTHEKMVTPEEKEEFKKNFEISMKKSKKQNKK